MFKDFLQNVTNQISTAVGNSLMQARLKFEAEQLSQQAIHQYQIGQFELALRSFQQALAIYRQISDRIGEGRNLNNIGLIYQILGQYSLTLEFYQQALIVQREIGDKASEVTTLNNIGVVYEKLGQYSQALELYQQTLAIQKDVCNRHTEATTLSNIGLVYQKLGQYSQALDFYHQALAIQKELGDINEGITLNNIGQVYHSMGQYQKGLSYYQQALDIRKKVGDISGEGGILNNIAEIYRDQGRYQKAQEFLSQALAIYKQIGDLAGQGITLNKIGLAYWNQGEYQKSLEYYHQSLEIRKKINDRPGESNTLNNIASAYDELGQYPLTLEFLNQALIIRKEIGDLAGEGTTLNNIGKVYRNLGQYTLALKFYGKALNIFRQIGSRTGEGATLNNIGEVYGKLKKKNKALTFFQKALAIAIEVENREGEGTSLSNLGNIHASLGSYTQALEYYQQDLTIIRELGNRAGEATILNNIGLACLNLNMRELALKFFEKSLDITREIGNRDGEAITLKNIGDALIQTGDLAQAETKLFSSINILESLRPGLKDADKISIFETQIYTYHLLQKVLVEQKKNDIALEVSERGRARAFIELLAERLSYESILLPKLDQIKNIAQKQNSTLIEYSIGVNEILIWLINPRGEIYFKLVDLKSLEQQNTSLLDLVNRTRASIGIIKQGEEIELLPPQLLPNNKCGFQGLQQIYQILIEPIVHHLPTDPKATIIFIPQGFLFLVPFAALQDEYGNFLIEKYTILTAPSIQVLELTRQQKIRLTTDVTDNLSVSCASQTSATKLVVGNPTMPTIPLTEPPQTLPQLEGAEEEAIAIANLLNTQPIIGDKATKVDIVKQMPSARLIHLATHGLLDDIKQLGVPGAIALAPSDGDNGFLTAGEIIEMKLNAELIILSGCHTGEGKITGDGIIGLSRSLFIAGVPSVIVSLWAVGDVSTQFLMTEFYKNILDSQMNKAQALRQAMLATKEEYLLPKYWAAFTLIGEAE